MLATTAQAAPSAPYRGIAQTPASATLTTAPPEISALIVWRSMASIAGPIT